MLLKNVASQGLYLKAVIASTGAPRTGDAANISGKRSIDGAAATALASGVTEIADGIYWQPLSQAETNGNTIGYWWASGTAGTAIDPLMVLTDRAVFPNAVAGASGGLPVIGAAPLSNLDALVSSRSTYAGGAVASVTAPVSLAAGAVDAAALAPDAGAEIAAAVWAAGARTLTAAGLDAVDVAGEALPDALRYMGAVLSGVVTGAGTPTEVFKDWAGADSVTVSVDASGNRSAVVLG